MTKTITSPVEEFPGTVKLPDRLTLPQALALELSITEAQVLKGATQAQYDEITVGLICEVVEEWGLDDFDQLSPETFPGSPRVASAELVAWIFGEILQIYNPDIPNE